MSSLGVGAEQTGGREPTIADRISVREVMGRELICARPDLGVTAVIRLVVDHHVGCVPVVDKRRKPIGVITKRDLVERLDAALQDGRRPSEVLPEQTAEEIMMPLALTLDERASVAHAAAMMTLEDVHHVLVTRGEVLIGVVSSKDVVDWIVRNDGLADWEPARFASGSDPT